MISFLREKAYRNNSCLYTKKWIFSDAKEKKKLV